jgi:formiminoglutamase
LKLPFLISVPHAGLQVPFEVASRCVLQQKDIIQDGDEGAAEIYLPLESKVAVLVTTDIARAIVDMNREETDRRKDGIVKTHTCWDIPVYKEPLSEEIIEDLLKNYYRPYHRDLTRLSKDVIMGIDCHTMAAVAPPVSPDPGKKRPRVCISNADGTCPEKWLHSLATCFEAEFQTDVSINDPFKGGHIIRAHSKEMPWIQLELSRESYLPLEEKSELVFQSIKNWYKSQKHLL